MTTSVMTYLVTFRVSSGGIQFMCSKSRLRKKMPQICEHVLAYFQLFLFFSRSWTASWSECAKQRMRGYPANAAASDILLALSVVRTAIFSMQCSRQCGVRQHDAFQVYMIPVTST